jgi:tRNA threonylcarbamoyladenosine modification (KEOPS) complex Cgi121 subunit
MKGAPEFRGIVIGFHSKKTKDLKQISEHGLQITISNCQVIAPKAQKAWAGYHATTIHN